MDSQFRSFKIPRRPQRSLGANVFEPIGSVSPRLPVQDVEIVSDWSLYDHFMAYPYVGDGSKFFRILERDIRYNGNLEKERVARVATYTKGGVIEKTEEFWFDNSVHWFQQPPVFSHMMTPPCN